MELRNASYSAEDEQYTVDIENNGLLINTLYSQERCARVAYFGVQLDEMWTFVGKKENQQWLWLALNPANRQIVAFHLGSRSGKDAQLFYENIPTVFKGEAGFFQIIGRLTNKFSKGEIILRLARTVD